MDITARNDRQTDRQTDTNMHQAIIEVQKKPGAPRQEALGNSKSGNGRKMGIFGQFGGLVIN